MIKIKRLYVALGVFAVLAISVSSCRALKSGGHESCPAYGQEHDLDQNTELSVQENT